MTDLMPIAQAFIATLYEDEVKADKDAVAALTEIANGDEEVYLNLRNQLGGMINELLQAQLREDAAVSREDVAADLESPADNVESATDSE